MLPEGSVVASALDVRLAARAVARHGLVGAFGHVSVRIDKVTFLVSAPQPLGSIPVKDHGVLVRMDGELPEGALPEVRMHREIYRRRPEVGGVCRVTPPSVMALSALGRSPRALHGLGTYFAPAAPFWPDVQLVRDDQRAEEVAALMGDCPAIVLRGNGAVTAAKTIREAAAYAYYLEDAARVDLALLPAHGEAQRVLEYTEEEARRRAAHTGGLIERMWQYLCFGDPEWSPQ